MTISGDKPEPDLRAQIEALRRDEPYGYGTTETDVAKWRGYDEAIDDVLSALTRGAVEEVGSVTPPEPVAWVHVADCVREVVWQDTKWFGLENGAPLYTSPPHQVAEVLTAWDDVKAERERQKAVEGWTLEHDDEHKHGELEMAAACLLVDATDARVVLDDEVIDVWGLVKKHHGNWRRELVIAAALALAALEQFDRGAILAKQVKETK